MIFNIPLFLLFLLFCDFSIKIIFLFPLAKRLSFRAALMQKNVSACFQLSAKTIYCSFSLFYRLNSSEGVYLCAFKFLYQVAAIDKCERKNAAAPEPSGLYICTLRFGKLSFDSAYAVLCSRRVCIKFLLFRIHLSVNQSRAVSRQHSKKDFNVLYSAFCRSL